MKSTLAFAAAVAIAMSAAPALAQSITPLRDWVPNIDRAAAAASTHGKPNLGHSDMSAGRAAHTAGAAER
ncbi:MAG TPA: hypothetical protein VG308_06255 [Stellaceae bacterium]|jgi:hypothetical protein|nr:hypothetical protein [Stellaceae bacterium]